MKPLLSIGVFAAASVGLLSGLFPPDSAQLVARGNAACERDEFVSALDFYTAAETRATDPGLVAFNKGVALYRLDRFREAELHFLRSREDASGERLARLLYNLGTTLVQEGQDRDPAVLLRATRAFEDCLNQPALAPDLREDAQFNLQVAKALLARAKARKNSSKSEDPNSQDRRPDSDSGTDDPRREAGEMLPGDAESRGGVPVDANSGKEGGREGTNSDQMPPPGVGNLPPIPDKDDVSSLSPEDTAAYLREVATRVLRERREHLRRLPAPPARTDLDW